MLMVAMIVSAQGEAMSAELIGKAIQRNAGYVTLRRIETAKEISKILSQGITDLFWMLKLFCLTSGKTKSMSRQVDGTND